MKAYRIKQFLIGAALVPLAALTGASTNVSAATSAGARNPVAACGHKAYFTSSAGHKLITLDARTGALLGTVPTGKAPINPTFNPDWTKVYVADSQGGTLTIVDVKTGKVEKTVPVTHLKPSGLRFLPDNKHLLISFLGETGKSPGWMGVMDLRTHKMVREWPIGPQSERFDITPDGKYAYVGNLGSQTMEVVDVVNGKVIATIPIAEPTPFNVLVTPQGDRAYIGSTRGKIVTVVNTKTNTIEQVIQTGEGPNGLAFSPDYKTIYVSLYKGGKLQAIDVATGRVSDIMSTGPSAGHLRVTPDGSRAIFVQPEHKGVRIVDLKTAKVLHAIDTDTATTTVAICGNP